MIIYLVKSSRSLNSYEKIVDIYDTQEVAEQRKEDLKNSNETLRYWIEAKILNQANEKPNEN